MQAESGERASQDRETGLGRGVCRQTSRSSSSSASRFPDHFFFLPRHLSLALFERPPTFRLPRLSIPRVWASLAFPLSPLWHPHASFPAIFSMAGPLARGSAPGGQPVSAVVGAGDGCV
eukprot:6201182-Pleurochrysis_carterae.AAC.1